MSAAVAQLLAGVVVDTALEAFSPGYVGLGQLKIRFNQWTSQTVYHQKTPALPFVTTFEQHNGHCKSR